eukprot:13158834-Alexandrium_andersonii.AAC.1
MHPFPFCRGLITVGRSCSPLWRHPLSSTSLRLGNRRLHASFGMVLMNARSLRNGPGLRMTTQSFSVTPRIVLMTS